MAYVIVVVIVAVVALVVLLLNWNNNSADSASVVDEDGNVVGEAIFRAGRFNIDTSKLKSASSQCLWDNYGTCQLIANLMEGESVDNGRYVVENVEVNQVAGTTTVVLDVNGFRTRPLSDREKEILPDGHVLTVIESLYQGYAGGVHSTKVCIK